jgi:hypothetical protein
MVVPEKSKYGIPPSNPKTTYGVGTKCATVLVISSFAYLSFDTSPNLGYTHKGFAVHLDSIRSIIPTSNYLRPICSGVTNSLQMFRAAWEMVWEAGLPDT